MITLLKYLNLPWELARGYLRQDLENLEYVINHFKSAVADQNNQIKGGALGASSFPGSSTIATRYVANTGPLNAPQWDQVDLTNGVKNQLPYGNFVAATGPSIVGAPASGSFQQITPNAEDVFLSGQLLDIGSLGSVAHLYGAL